MIYVKRGTYKTDDGRDKDPANREIPAWSKSKHVGNIFVELLHTIPPGYGCTFPRGYPQKTEATCTVGIKQLEKVHTALK